MINDLLLVLVLVLLLPYSSYSCPYFSRNADVVFVVKHVYGQSCQQATTKKRIVHIPTAVLICGKPDLRCPAPVPPPISSIELSRRRAFASRIMFVDASPGPIESRPGRISIGTAKLLALLVMLSLSSERCRTRPMPLRISSLEILPSLFDLVCESDGRDCGDDEIC